MSAFAGTGRILFLGALCCSAAFLDVHSGRSASAPEANGGSALRIQLPENKSGVLAVPQLGPYATGLKADGKDTAKIHSSSTMSAAEISSKWSELQTRIHADAMTIATCRANQNACTQAARRFLSIFDIGRRHEGRVRLGWLNRAVNMAVRATSDWAQYGVADFWASPLQTMDSEAGDCEDYAIVKYAALRELGVPADDLRLVIVQDEKRETGHAIVAVRYEERWLVLDNRTMAILNAEDVRDYRPLFALDEHGTRTIATAALDLTTDQ
ncbi:MAG TPA: transglutaminase-like cysteine peptidase [Lacipirellulaceae bacterium]|nr:transglutaminase-like cysteine peptidase [Lacipirellulaceae bacterium]